MRTPIQISLKTTDGIITLKSTIGNFGFISIIHVYNDETLLFVCNLVERYYESIEIEARYRHMLNITYIEAIWKRIERHHSDLLNYTKKCSDDSIIKDLCVETFFNYIKTVDRKNKIDMFNNE